MEKILEKEPVKRVKDTLIKSSIKTELLVLNSSARTAVDAASTLKCNVGAIVKSLLLKAEESFLICLVAGDKRCSLNKLKKILNKRDVRMANANEVKENTGFTIGGVSPVGHIKKLDIWIYCLNSYTS